MSMNDEFAGRPKTEVDLYVGKAQFDRGLTAIRELIEARALWLLVGPPQRRLQFEMIGSEAEEALSRHGLTADDIRAVLLDLEDVLSAAVSGVSVEVFSQRRADPERFSDGETEPVDVAREKFDAAQRVLPIDQLRRRVWVKSTSKIDVPSRLDWEVVSKHVDAERPTHDASPVAYATLRIAAEPPEIRLSALGEGKEVTMVVDAEDVAYMIGALGRLQTSLARVDREEGDRARYGS